MSESMTNVVISLRTAGRGKAADQTHLVKGLLVQPALVMVPDPPEALMEHDAEFGIVVLPASEGSGLSAHHPHPQELSIIRAATDQGMAAVAFIWLAESSPHLPWRGPLNQSRLERAFEETGSLWVALERVGAIPPAFYAVAHEDFADLVIPPDSTRRPLVRREVSLKDADCGIVCRICMITHICK
jgi:hypothetical protein